MKSESHTASYFVSLIAQPFRSEFFPSSPVARDLSSALLKLLIFQCLTPSLQNDSAMYINPVNSCAPKYLPVPV